MNYDLSVDLGERSYPIFFRPHGQDELAERVLGEAKTGKVIIITDKNWFMTEILSVLHREQNLSFAQFVQAWFSKMDFIASRESTRINLLAI